MLTKANKRQSSEHTKSFTPGIYAYQGGTLLPLRTNIYPDKSYGSSWIHSSICSGLAAEVRQVQAAQYGISDLKKADAMQKSSRQAEAEVGPQHFGVTRAWKLREDINKRRRTTSDEQTAVIVRSIPRNHQRRTVCQKDTALTEQEQHTLRESKILPHVSIAKPILVSHTLHNFVQRRVDTHVGIHSIEVGGNAD